TGRGVVLFSHAPTRAALSSDPRQLGSSSVGSLQHGAREVEALLLDAERFGTRLFHLSGHTHWSDLWLAPKGASACERAPYRRLPCPTETNANAAMVNAPSATRIGFHTVEHGRAFGFVVLRLSADRSLVQFKLFDRAGRSLRCENP